MNRVELLYGAASDVGRVRAVNEDSYLVCPPVFVVADGMGGHSGGDVASAMVVEELARLADRSFGPQTGLDAVQDALVAAQARINEYAEAHRRAGAHGWFAGTTAVVGLLVDDDGEPRWLVANLGDSRAYRWHRGGLEQVSVDHSVVEELRAAGAITAEEMATHPERHVVTRALGGLDSAHPDVFWLPGADRLLLCSDGITGMLSDAEVAAVLGAADDPRDAADSLVAAAVRAGGLDNATAVVVDVVGWSPPGADVSGRQQVSLEEKLGALP